MNLINLQIALVLSNPFLLSISAAANAAACGSTRISLIPFKAPNLGNVMLCSIGRLFLWAYSCPLTILLLKNPPSGNRTNHLRLRWMYFVAKCSLSKTTASSLLSGPCKTNSCKLIKFYGLYNLFTHRFNEEVLMVGADNSKVGVLEDGVHDPHDVRDHHWLRIESCH